MTLGCARRDTIRVRASHPQGCARPPPAASPALWVHPRPRRVAGSRSRPPMCRRPRRGRWYPAPILASGISPMKRPPRPGRDDRSHSMAWPILRRLARRAPGAAPACRASARRPRPASRRVMSICPRGGRGRERAWPTPLLPPARGRGGGPLGSSPPVGEKLGERSAHAHRAMVPRWRRPLAVPPAPLMPSIRRACAASRVASARSVCSAALKRTGYGAFAISAR